MQEKTWIKELMTLLNALTDCRDDVLSGKPIDFVDIAKCYGLNPKLLERKFFENHPSGEVKKLPTYSEYVNAKSRENLSVVLRFFDIPAHRHNKAEAFSFGGHQYIGLKINEDKIFASRLDTGAAVQFRGVPMTAGKKFWFPTEYSPDAIRNMKRELSE